MHVKRCLIKAQWWQVINPYTLESDQGSAVRACIIRQEGLTNPPNRERTIELGQSAAKAVENAVLSYNLYIITNGLLANYIVSDLAYCTSSEPQFYQNVHLDHNKQYFMFTTYYLSDSWFAKILIKSHYQLHKQDNHYVCADTDSND